MSHIRFPLSTCKNAFPSQNPNPRSLTTVWDSVIRSLNPTKIASKPGCFRSAWELARVQYSKLPSRRMCCEPLKGATVADMYCEQVCRKSPSIHATSIRVPVQVVRWAVHHDAIVSQEIRSLCKASCHVSCEVLGQDGYS